MSEEIIKMFEGVEDISPEQILSQLLKKKKVEFHTEINNPLNMTALEVLADYVEIKIVKKILKKWIKKFKTNMVAYDRKRATEIVEAYKSRKESEEEKSLKNLLLGK